MNRIRNQSVYDKIDFRFLQEVYSMYLIRTAVLQVERLLFMISQFRIRGGSHIFFLFLHEKYVVGTH